MQLHGFNIEFGDHHLSEVFKVCAESLQQLPGLVETSYFQQCWKLHACWFLTRECAHDPDRKYWASWCLDHFKTSLWGQKNTSTDWLKWKPPELLTPSDKWEPATLPGLDSTLGIPGAQWMLEIIPTLFKSHLPQRLFTQNVLSAHNGTPCWFLLRFATSPLSNPSAVSRANIIALSLYINSCFSGCILC